jgi:hypothetical protein
LVALLLGKLKMKTGDAIEIYKKLEKFMPGRSPSTLANEPPDRPGRFEDVLKIFLRSRSIDPLTPMQPNPKNIPDPCQT